MKKLTLSEKENIIRKTASRALLEEIEQLLDMALCGEWESVTNLVEAFYDTSDKADSYLEWKYLLKPSRKVHIALGEYVPMTPEQVAKTFSTNGNAWDFKLNKIPYTWVGDLL